jgi:hypothetical protein
MIMDDKMLSLNTLPVKFGVIELFGLSQQNGAEKEDQGDCYQKNFKKFIR